MTNIPKNGDTGDQNPDPTIADEALNPIAPKASKLGQDVLESPSIACEPEATPGTGLNPP